MLSLYTGPGVTISVAQQDALYRECLQTQRKQALSDPRLEQTHSSSGSGVVILVNQASTSVQNVTLPRLQLLMQPPRSPTPVMPLLNSNTFVPNFLANPQANKNRDQPTVHLRPKKASMPGQLLLPSSLFAQKQNPPQFNVPQEKQLPIALLPHNLHQTLNPLVKPPHLKPPQQSFISQPPVIPSPILVSATTYPNILNIPQQNIVNTPQARLVSCPTALKHPLNCNLDLKLWRFPHNNPTIVNQVTNTANVFNNFCPTLPPNTANPTISHPTPQLVAPQNFNSNQVATCGIPVNPKSKTTNIAPSFVTPVIPPKLGYTAPMPLWGHRFPRLLRQLPKKQA